MKRGNWGNPIVEGLNELVGFVSEREGLTVFREVRNTVPESGFIAHDSLGVTSHPGFDFRGEIQAAFEGISAQFHAIRQRLHRRIPAVPTPTHLRNASFSTQSRSSWFIFASSSA